MVYLGNSRQPKNGKNISPHLRQRITGGARKEWQEPFGTGNPAAETRQPAAPQSEGAASTGRGRDWPGRLLRFRGERTGQVRVDGEAAVQAGRAQELRDREAGGGQAH